MEAKISEMYLYMYLSIGRSFSVPPLNMEILIVYYRYNILWNIEFGKVDIVLCLSKKVRRYLGGKDTTACLVGKAFEPALDPVAGNGKCWVASRLEAQARE